MATYAAPGIYVKEEPGGARPIGAVGTSTAGFVGAAPDRDARLGEAVAVNNWTEFTKHFASGQDMAGTELSRAVWGFFGNGGGRCFIVNHPEGEALEGGGPRRSGLQLLEAVDEVAIVAAPGHVGVQNYEAILTHCERAEDRVAILDAAPDVDDVTRLTEVETLGSGDDGSGSAGGESGTGDDSAPASARGGGGLRPRQSSYGAVYFPWLMAYDPLSTEVVKTAPSGHMAGVWARVDTVRGVHKAPANEPINGALDLSYLVTRQEQEVLNPKGVNCIRKFGTEGIRVWGARTLTAEADEFRYLNVRRLFNMLKESIAEGTMWIVFEPNEYKLWTSIRTEIGEFLTRVWRDGALFGRTPQEAFFVKCDEETNPPEVRNAGQVVALVGVAPVKPAEFVIFKISQWAGGAQTESVGG
ncbi:MAG: phage tail sheath family protein [Haloechinothrix sp.]